MNLNLSLPARIGLNLVALLGGIAVLRLGSAIFLPLIYAVLGATILWPSANRLHAYYRFPWTLASVTAVGVLVLFNLIILTGIVLAVPRLLQSVPGRDQIDQSYANFRLKVMSWTGRDAVNPPKAEPEKNDDANKTKQDEKKEEKKDLFDEYLPENPYQAAWFGY